MNLAHTWVIGCGKTVTEARKEYDDACIDFAGDLIEGIGRGRLAYFNDIGHPRWRYHAAAEIDGIIHDLWSEDAMTVEEFLAVMHGGWVDYPAE